jgi:hypothetical protein
MSILFYKLPLILAIVPSVILSFVSVILFFNWIAYKSKDIILILNKDGRFNLKFINKKSFIKDGGAVVDGKLYLAIENKSMNLMDGNKRLYIYDNGKPLPRTDIMFGDDKAMSSATILKYVNDKNLQDLAGESINPKIVFMILALSGFNLVFIVFIALKTFNVF